MPKIVYHDSEGVEKSVDLSTEPVLIGRATECQIQTQDGLVSRRHARVVYDGLYWIEDTGSANGVYKGSERVQRAQLRPGDEVHCGSLTLRFLAEATRPPPPPAPMGAQAQPVIPPTYHQPPPSASSATHGRSYHSPPPSSASPLAGAPPPVVAPPPWSPPPPPLPPQPSQQSQHAVDRVDAALLQHEKDLRQAAERDRDEARRRLDELNGQVAAQAASRAAAAAADSAREQELARLRQRADQAEADLRRVRANTIDAAALRPVEDERDRLRARVAELEGQLARAAAAPAAGADQAGEVQRLQRKIEQLESERRRLRGGGAAAALPDPAADARVADLEERLRQAEMQRDEAVRRSTISVRSDSTPTPAVVADPAVQRELEMARRQIDQLQADLRRRTSAMPAASPAAELERALSQLRDVQRERDSLQAAVAGGAFRPSQRVSDGLTAVSDLLADLRGSVRAGDTASAETQLEQARQGLRDVMTQLGLPT